MHEAHPSATKLEEYRVPAYLVDETHLSFDLSPEYTDVSSRLLLRRNPDGMRSAGHLRLDGQTLELLSIELDGRPISDNEYQLGDECLELFNVPDRCELTLCTRIYPEQNTALEGLYKSGMYCTQCEAEGFRKITYYPDRPDVLSKFTTTIIANDSDYPILLSNGNRVGEERQADGRLAVTWHDPFPKPSYLFALVAGDLAVLEDKYTTGSGRAIDLRIYSESHNIAHCAYAMDALKRSMRWDEGAFGREYDLDSFMIVAVDDFNMGAMENKGLNIFNTSCVLASPDTATDAAYERVEAVVAHEYFHNWSGNRVTCRDWFQLSLKEGFTVFRDAQFSADMNSQTVKRIEDVNFLRTVQFAEDAGPMAHPIRPDSYIEISNFYTTTIYEKGAEVVRMIHTLLGAENFRSGSDLYFQRHDGCAVTTEDFVLAMEDASGVDLTQFRRWYSQAGTPHLSVKKQQARDGVTLLIRQSCPDTPGQAAKLPFHIPLKMGLIGKNGKDMLGGSNPKLNISGNATIEDVVGSSSCLVHLKEQETRLQISFQGEQTGEPDEIAVSLLRSFSAPLTVDFERTSSELYFLAAHDTDGFARWDAMVQVFCNQLATVREHTAGDAEPITAEFEQLIGHLIETSLKAADDGEQKAMFASMLVVPGESYLHEQMPIIDVEGIARARETLRARLGMLMFEEWQALYSINQSDGVYTPGGVQSARRGLKAVALGYMSMSEDPMHKRIVHSLVQELMDNADNLTDRMLALRIALGSEAFAESELQQLLSEFYQRWKGFKLVVDQWVLAQATCPMGQALKRVEVLERHEAFDVKNPNSVRMLYGAFCSQNHRNFHQLDGSGYRFLSERVKRLDALNPQIAARILTPLTRWRRFDITRQGLMKTVLTDLLEQNAGSKNLSKDVYEIISKSLAD